MGSLGHDHRVLDAGVVASVVGGETEIVFEGSRGDPGFGYACFTITTNWCTRTSAFVPELLGSSWHHAESSVTAQVNLTSS